MGSTDINDALVDMKRLVARDTLFASNRRAASLHTN